MLTKKHFKFLAKSIAASQSDRKHIGPEGALENLQQSIVEFCQEQNPRFDTQKFKEAARL